MASGKDTHDSADNLPRHNSGLSDAIASANSKSVVAASYALWREKYVKSFDGMLYVAHNEDGSNMPKDAVTVSEAIGYGMLISLMVGQREDFEGFLAFYNGHLNARGLMAWQQVLRNGLVLTNPDPAASAYNCATDADSDVAYALLLAVLRAARQWGCEEYRKRGREVCALIWKHCINHVTHMPMLGGWVGGPDDRFGPLKDRAYCDICRPSDFVLSHYLVFAQEDEEHASGWRSVIEASLAALGELLGESRHGLCADFMAFDAAAGGYKAVTTQVLERPGDGTFSWNACRMPWRVAVYYWETGDERVLPLMQALAKFFCGENEIMAGYALDGTAMVDYATLSFIAPAWCLLRVMGNPHADELEKECLRHLLMGWGTYFGECILLMARLQLERRWLNLLPQSSLFSSF